MTPRGASRRSDAVDLSSCSSAAPSPHADAPMWGLGSSAASSCSCTPPVDAASLQVNGLRMR
eukprot:CAMPEP_0176137534 /NCGR_PEP_ID=MMETSP0120_2-20121206/69827_1 /TAXON_ID=160619 /ORGANISM="Kryptoperidinium foliaceum, Strain CCMP 1326" /LENGTH=61 /DNA_ID=CAMNT_0017473387 /DNA_START=101 /DNA_END=282 /DNA_ORIENTATION=+